jgi:putative tricarboxylic transport membrane protein
MFEHALVALNILLEPIRLAMLFSGMVAGMIFGMLPGLGGVAAVSILLPFIYLLDAYAGLALLLGAISVVYTADTITSVLIGAPGSPASAPTAIEGHALAKKGEAARALGVGFLASMVGGLMGALILLFAIPVAGPIVLALGTPELFMFALVGLYYASSMITKDLSKGLGAACFGLLLGVVGAAPAAADFRFTFGQAYLMDGLSLTIVALGLFGVAEIISMLAAGGGISNTTRVMTSWGSGFLDFRNNIFLVLRSSVIGVFGGFVPAVGASASTWVAYGHAQRSSKGKTKFGNGEIKGIAAAEGANNATIISDLVPTLLFSVPGGPAAAIFLGALFTFGYYPGPRMVSENPDLMFLIVWSVALTSIVGAALCFCITPYIARLTTIRFGLIAAPLMLVMVVGALQSTNTIGDVFMLALLGLVGWLMKQADWPRAPALVGFVLAEPMEQYFWLSNKLHGLSWLIRPGVLIIAALILVPILIQMFKRLTSKKAEDVAHNQSASITLPSEKNDLLSSLVLAFGVSVVFIAAFIAMFDFDPESRLLPSVAIIPGGIFAIIALLKAIKSLGNKSHIYVNPELPFILAVLIYVGAMWMFGFDMATLGLVAWMLFFCAKLRLVAGVLYGSVVIAFSYSLIVLMKLEPPPGILLNLNFIN